MQVGDTEKKNQKYLNQKTHSKVFKFFVRFWEVDVVEDFSGFPRICLHIFNIITDKNFFL